MKTSIQPRPEERSLAQLLSDVTRESSDLLRKEIELAKLEIGHNIAELKTGIASMGIAVPLLFAGFLVLLAAAVLGLDLVVQRPWLSALLVGSVVTLAGMIAFVVGQQRMKEIDVKPEQTVESLRDDKEMLQHHVSS